MAGRGEAPEGGREGANAFSCFGRWHSAELCSPFLRLFASTILYNPEH